MYKTTINGEPVYVLSIQEHDILERFIEKIDKTNDEDMVQ